MTLTSERTSPTTAVFRRRFASPPEKVWHAHITPALVQKWMTGPEGWSMPVCQIEATEGGKFRFEYERPDQPGFVIFGHFETLEKPNRIVHIEQMELPDMTTPPTRIETRFDAVDGGTAMTMTMETESADALDGLLQSGMETGMEETYARLDAAA